MKGFAHSLHHNFAINVNFAENYVSKKIKQQTITTKKLKQTNQKTRRIVLIKFW